jgi:hypothetical protein
MRIAVIGGPELAGILHSLMARSTKHHVTVVFEKQPMLGDIFGPQQRKCSAPNNQSRVTMRLEVGARISDCLSSFIALMQELEVEQTVHLGSGLFLKDGRHFLSGGMIEKNFTGIHPPD